MKTDCTGGCYWELHVLPRRLFQCSNCGEILPLLKAEAMLNEYETLKAATERLSAEDASIAYDNLAELFKTGEHPVCQSLKAYANALEGK